MFEATAMTIGPVVITDTVVTTWGIMLALAVLSWLLGRRLVLSPASAQVVGEGIVGAIEQAVHDVLPEHAQRVLPFIATLWVFLIVANLSGLIPGVHAPTRDLSATSALAVRLFGNMMSLELAALLVLLVAGFLAPVPLLMLHIVEALVQAYIFGMLALIYLAGAIQSQQLRQSREKE